MTETATENGSGKPRIRWLDTARGLSVVLVVIHHATEWLGYAGADIFAAHAFNEMIASLRIPVFFLVSGLLARSWMMRSWKTLFKSKIYLLFWVYILWSLIQEPFFVWAKISGFVPGAEHLSVTQEVLALASILIRPRGPLWFIWALAIFLIIARATVKFPNFLQITLATVSSVAGFALIYSENVGSQLFALGLDSTANLLLYYLYFLLGMLFSTRIIEVWSSFSSLKHLGIICAWLLFLGFGALFALDHVWLWPTLLRLFGAFAGLSIACLFVKLNSIVFESVGHDTLPIYVMHTPLIILAVVSSSTICRLDGLGALGAICVILGISSASVLTSLLFVRKFVQAGFPLNWLFGPPRYNRKSTKPN